MEKVKIKSIRRINPETRYDLSVIKHHNFFANNILVHNCRNITIVNEFGNVNCYSREGKEFFTLDVLKEEVKKLNLTSVVLDGEICIVDDNGKEDFQSIMKVIRKKDYTIPNPKYKLFDMIPLNDFFRKESRILLDERLHNLYGALQNYKGDKLEILNQKKITCEADLDMLLEKARENKWEGLIVRKNTFYKGKRSNDLLKIKDFHDAEYVVENTVNGEIRFINKDSKEETMEGLSSVVGSGFSIEQRKLYKEHPEMIIGKTITVKYFEETQNKDGGISLRFPTIKHIYEDGRDV
jgi:DNA ligase-1